MAGAASRPCPAVRPSVDLGVVRTAEGDAYCLYDRLDPDAGQVLVGEAALDAVYLLDGTRSLPQLHAAYSIRTGRSVNVAQLGALVDRLDGALLLDSARYRAHVAHRLESFRSAPARPAAHAGGAYPDEPGELREFLDAQYSREGGPRRWPGTPSGPSPRALVAPHIDLHRGGHSYAWGYGELASRDRADVYVLLGTCHAPMSSPFAMTTKGYDTPLGLAPTDEALVRQIADAAPFDPLADELMHRNEHSLEFQAVYLRYLGLVGDGAGTIVPILCVPPHDTAPGASPSASEAATGFLTAVRDELARDGRRVCFVAGVDFAHVGPQFNDPGRVDAEFADGVRRGDSLMLEHVARGDAEGFWTQVTTESPRPGMAGESAAVGGPRRVCGLAPLYATLWLIGPSEGRVLHYDQWIGEGGSGSVTFGSVVFP